MPIFTPKQRNNLLSPDMLLQMNRPPFIFGDRHSLIYARSATGSPVFTNVGFSHCMIFS